MAATLNWGIIGTGAIAKTFAKGVLGSTHGKLVAVGSRSAESAAKFADEFKIAGRHASYEALLADKSVEAVYVAVPHTWHAELAIAAARAGKHVLVEKPAGINRAEWMAITEAAHAAGTFLMEAFMYRCHPQTAKLVELVKAKAIGDVRVIQGTFSFHWPKPFNPDHRLTSDALAGGGILDVGCYPVSAARLIAGAAMGKAFADPTDVKGVAHLESTGVDGYAIATLKFAGGILAQCSTGIQVDQINHLVVYGSEGRLELVHPWVPGQKEIIRVVKGDKTEEVVVETPAGLYSLEADEVARCVAAGLKQSPRMSWDDTAGNLATLDSWRSSAGQMYSKEKPAALQPVPPRKIARKPDAVIPTGTIPGVGRPVSRLVQGADSAGGAWRESFAIFDAFFEAGGNAFDTSHWYGTSDHRLGDWIRTRGLAKDVVVLGKGGHAPFNYPAIADKQIHESLANLGVEKLDVYCFHRDNPDVPVGEFVDMINGHIKAGRVGAWGGSNWTIGRVKAANEYAALHKLAPLAVLSNQFSLARMLNPVWGGCIGVGDDESRTYLESSNICLMPWSSQARGFFVDGLAAPDKKDNEELVRCWYSPENFKRLERAKEVGAKHGVSALNIALAYVLHQKFPTFPLIGPRQISELRTSLPALGVKLTPDEVLYLDLRK